MNNAAVAPERQERITDWWDTSERMSSQDCADYLNITLNTFYHYLSTGRLQVKLYRLGRRNYYKRSEFLAAITRLIK